MRQWSSMLVPGSVWVEGWEFFQNNLDEFFELFQQHLILVFAAVGGAIAFAMPIAILATRNDRSRTLIMNFGNVAQTLPTLAVIALIFPILGIGFWPSLVGLWLYAILPILINTVTGIEDVDESTVEAARGMGMTEFEVLRKIQLPLASSVIFAGIRTSTVLTVGTAYLAYFIGGGGLGVWVVTGITTLNPPMILAGAVPGAVLAVTLDTVLSAIERYLGGEGLHSGSSMAA